MSVKYPFEGWTRVALLPAIDDMGFPTVAEIAAGVDITCDLTADGLRLGRSTETIDRTPWAGDLVVERATRVSFSASLTGFRFVDPDDEALWPAAVLKDTGFLVVRRGIRYEQPFAATQPVETLGFQFGERSPADPGDALSTFTVPILVDSRDADAVVAA